MGVVRRLKIPEMAKFNFAVNFGLDSKKLSLLHDIFKKDVDDIDSQLDKLEND